MNIQSISFGAKHRPNYHRPMLPKNNSHASNATLEQAIKKYEQTIKEDRTTLPWTPDSRIDTPAIEELREMGQNALNALPMIKNTASFAQNKAKDISWEAKQIQAQVDKLAQKIKATEAWKNFVADKADGLALKMYPDEVKLDKKIYDVEIYADGSATAIERVTSQKRPLVKYELEAFGRNIYKFDLKTGKVSYFAQKQKEYHEVVSAEKEYKFEDGILFEYNEGASKGEFELISQQYRFCKDGSLFTFATAAKTTGTKTPVEYWLPRREKTTERLFIFDRNGVLETFASGLKYQNNGVATAKKLYSFDENEKLNTFENDVVARYRVLSPFADRMYEIGKKAEKLTLEEREALFARGCYDKHSREKAVFLNEF